MSFNMRPEPLRCADLAPWISTQVDAEGLPPEARSRLLEHLEACASCRELFAEERERSSFIAAALTRSGEEHKELARAILAEAGEMRARGELLEPGARAAFRLPRRLLAPALAATLLAACAAWWCLSPRAAGPKSMTPETPWVTFTSHPVELHLKQGWGGGSAIPDADGSPLGRRLLHDRWILRDTLRAEGTSATPMVDPASAGELMIDLERVRTGYTRLVSWPYQ
jgi:hypothetical protein